MNSKEIYNMLLNRYFDEVSHKNTNDAIKQLFDKWEWKIDETQEDVVDKADRILYLNPLPIDFAYFIKLLDIQSYFNKSCIDKPICITINCIDIVVDSYAMKLRIWDYIGGEIAHCMAWLGDSFSKFVHVEGEDREAVFVIGDDDIKKVRPIVKEGQRVFRKYSLQRYIGERIQFLYNRLNEIGFFNETWNQTEQYSFLYDFFSLLKIDAYFDRMSPKDVGEPSTEKYHKIKDRLNRGNVDFINSSEVKEFLNKLGREEVSELHRWAADFFKTDGCHSDDGMEV